MSRIMVAERERKQTGEQLLESYVGFGLRDAKDHPDAPALTLIKGLSNTLVETAFEKMGRDFSDDLEVQAFVFAGYVKTKAGEGKSVTVETFKDSGGEGFNVFVKKQ